MSDDQTERKMSPVERDDREDGIVQLIRGHVADLERLTFLAAEHGIEVDISSVPQRTVGFHVAPRRIICDIKKVL